MIKPGYRKPKSLDRMRSRRRKNAIIKIVYAVFLVAGICYFMFKN